MFPLSLLSLLPLSIIYSTIYSTWYQSYFSVTLNKRLSSVFFFFFFSNFSFVALYQLPIASVIAPINRSGPDESRSIEHSLIGTSTLLHARLQVVTILSTRHSSTSTRHHVGPIRKVADPPYRSSDDGSIPAKNAPIRYLT
jgi:hypothetical protein